MGGAINYIIAYEHDNAPPRRRRAVTLAAALSLLLLACACAKDKPGASEPAADAAAPAPTGEPAAAAALPEAPAAGPTPPGKAVYDLNIMSLCPYGITALAEIADLLRAFPESELNLWFIGRVEGNKLASLRGEPEMLDEALWLGVKALYPARYREFLSRRAAAATELPTEALRWIVLADEFPKSYNKYLKRYAGSPASSYWFNWLKPCKISPKKFMCKIEAGQKAQTIEKYGEEIAAVYQGEPAVIMLNNRAKITPQGEQGLEKALAELAR